MQSPPLRTFGEDLELFSLDFSVLITPFCNTESLENSRGNEWRLEGIISNDLMFGDDEKEEEQWPSVIESVPQRGILTSA